MIEAPLALSYTFVTLYPRLVVEALHTEPLSSTSSPGASVVASSAKLRMLVAWLATLVLLLAFLGTPPVQRTQEARVLVTAREMLQLGGDRWIIPQMNGRLRLEKPPLAYWLTAGAFALGGVNEWAGRVPTALCGWLAIFVVYLVASRWFDRRAAFFAAASLLGGMMFFRHVRLAETDAWVMLFDTCAIGAIWRGAEAGGARGAWRWFLASGLFVALAALAKGVPALYVLLFLVAAAIEWRDWRLLLRWIKSGAPIVAIVLGLGWFAYIAHAVGMQTFLAELKALRGEDHAASNLDYPPQLLRGLLPWTGFAIAAIVAATMSWRSDRRARVLLMWCGCILLPLLVAPQKQHHYLMPIYPPLALLTGWLVAEATRTAGDQRAATTVRIILNLTLLALVLGALALPLIVRRFGRGDVISCDLLLCGAIIVGSVILWQLSRRRGLLAAMAVFSVLVALMMPLALGAWAPTLQPQRAKENAAQIQRPSGGHKAFCFWGENVSIPLVWELRTIVPRVMTERELNDLRANEPNLLVLSIARRNRPAPPLPGDWQRVGQMTDEERTLEVYRAAR
jgi:4-amino-4-deoxy-L-arabinose transferase-like glycosyltransferase